MIVALALAGTLALGAGTPALRMTPQKPGASTPTAVPPRAAPRFTLSASRVLVDTDIEIRFAAPVVSTTTDRLWVAIARQNAPATSFETWAYIANGARVVTLRAPRVAGAYEVRIYTGYPRLQYNIGRTELLAVEPIVDPTAVAPVAGPKPVAPAHQRFTLAAAKVKARTKIALVFPQPMVASPGEQFWVTVVARGEPDNVYDAWTYVAANGTRAELPAPAFAGPYEVRLHANYPSRSWNVVHRAPLQVE